MGHKNIHIYSQFFREFCLSILSVLFKIVTFSALETSHSLACTFYEFVKVCRCFYATNENIHVFSMKFPHLFLRPEIIITFLWGWEWSGGQVRHRSLRNSGSYFSMKAYVEFFLFVSEDM